MTFWQDLTVIWEMFPYAVLSGLLIATVCALLGVFVVLKRIVFIGIALSQVAAAGIALAFLLHFPPILGAAAATLLCVTVLACPYETERVPRDAVLGAVFLLASALSILIVAKSGFGLDEVKALLYGDLIITGKTDLLLISCILLPVLAVFLLFLRPIVYTFVDREQARVLGIRTFLWELLFFYLLGIAVSGSSNMGGALLVFCHLTVPPMAGMLLCRRLWNVVAVSVGIACASTLLGIYLSFRFDLPTNQLITVVAGGFLLVAAVVRTASRAIHH